MGGLEWIPYVFLLSGIYIAGKRNKPYGWAIQSIGCFLFIIFASIFQIWGIAVGNAIFFIFSLAGYFEQKKLKNTVDTVDVVDKWGMRIIDKDKYIAKCLTSGVGKRPNL